MGIEIAHVQMRNESIHRDGGDLGFHPLHGGGAGIEGFLQKERWRGDLQRGLDLQIAQLVAKDIRVDAKAPVQQIGLDADFVGVVGFRLVGIAQRETGETTGFVALRESDIDQLVRIELIGQSALEGVVAEIDFRIMEVFSGARGLKSWFFWSHECRNPEGASKGLGEVENNVGEYGLAVRLAVLVLLGVDDADRKLKGIGHTDAEIVGKAVFEGGEVGSGHPVDEAA